jgi:uncharacterized protein YjfI (DUF2170 family)
VYLKIAWQARQGVYEALIYSPSPCNDPSDFEQKIRRSRRLADLPEVFVAFVLFATFCSKSVSGFFSVSISACGWLS